LTKKKPSAIDLFSGCGGLTSGLRQAGFVVRGAVEISTAAAYAYRLNHPNVYLFEEDIRGLTSRKICLRLGIKKGMLDLLAGCSPCQGFSRLRTRNGKLQTDDQRNDLVLEFVRCVEDLLPRTILFENVPGILADYRFGKMQKRLEKVGYYISYAVVDLARYGVPQRRRRLIMLGSQLGPIDLPALCKGRLPTVRSTIENLESPVESDDSIHKSVTQHAEYVMERIRLIPKNGGSRKALGADRQLSCHSKFDGYNDVYGRMSWDKPAPTITRFSFNPSKGRYLHPEEDRSISLREAAMLQTFPRHYLFPLNEFGRMEVASMIGEAVPPRAAEVLGVHMRKHLEA